MNRRPLIHGCAQAGPLAVCSFDVGSRSSVKPDVDDESALPRGLDRASSIVRAGPCNRLGRGHSGQASKNGNGSSGAAHTPSAGDLDSMSGGLVVCVTKYVECLRPVLRKSKIGPADPDGSPLARLVAPSGQIHAKLRRFNAQRRSESKSTTADLATVRQDHKTHSVVVPRPHLSTMRCQS